MVRRAHVLGQGSAWTRRGGGGGHDNGPHQRPCPWLGKPNPPLLQSPPFCQAGSPPQGGGGHEVTVTPWEGGGGVAPQICTIVSQCRSALAPSAPSIAFGSAPRREANSQPISQLVRPADSQTVRQSFGQTGKKTSRQKHTVWVFFSVADSGASSGKENSCQNKKRSNGNAAGHGLLGRRFESRSADDGGGAIDNSGPGRIRIADLQCCCWLHHNSPTICSGANRFPHCLNPSEHKLLNPPPFKK